MLYTAVIFCLGLTAALAQDECIGESNLVSYTNCGAIVDGDFVMNLYWTPLDDQTNILFEVLDETYASFGFTADIDQPMNDASVMFGCDNFDLEVVQLASGIDDLPISPWDARLPLTAADRSVANVAAGFDANELAILDTPDVTRLNGVCGIRFERLNVLGLEGEELKDIISGVENLMIWAVGDQDVPDIHTLFNAVSHDLILDTGDLVDVQPFLEEEDPEEEEDEDIDDEEDAASSLSQSAMLVASAAAFTAALW